MTQSSLNVSGVRPRTRLPLNHEARHIASRWRVRICALAGAVAVMLAGGCSLLQQDDHGEEAELRQITYLTGFGTFGREAPAYVALDLGYFREAGLDVDIVPGTGTGGAIEATTTGQAHFALADLTGALLQYGLGVSDDFVVVAGIQQRTLMGIMTLDEAETDVTAPRDLEGLTVADTPGSVGVLLWPTYANLAGVDPEAVEWIDAPPPELPGLLAGGEVGAIAQFVVGRPSIEAATGGSVIRVLPYSDYLADLYGIALITSRQLVEDDPELVDRFTNALLRGVEYALDNPEQAGQIIASSADVDPEVAAAEIALMRPYIREGVTAVGTLDRIRVAQSIALLEAAGAIPEGMTPDDVVSYDFAPDS